MKREWSAWLSHRFLDRRGGHRREVMRLFREAQIFDYWGPQKRMVLRQERLAGLLNHAREHVPFYRDRLQEAGPIISADAFDVLRRLPVVQREQLQKNPSAFCSEVEEGREDYTGGSTGTPLQFKVDSAMHRSREASLMWADSHAGWRPGEKMAMLWGADKDLRSALRSWKLHLRWWMENRRWYNAFDMGPFEMEHFHQELRSFCPDWLVAYAGAAHTYAGFLTEAGHRPSYPRRGVICSAEVLTDSMRQDIADVFRCPLFDRYGNRETGAIAAECMAHQGLHINEAQLVVEVNSPDPMNEPGAILVTSLVNWAMPFIRYDTGDLGLWRSHEDCSCGRRSLRLARIMGRQSDVIQTRTGQCIHGEFFTHLFYGSRGVQQFQFVQESGDDYRLLLKADEDQCRRLEDGWRQAIRDKVGPSAGLRIDYVQHIPPSPSGKRRFTYSKKGAHTAI